MDKLKEWLSLVIKGLVTNSDSINIDVLEDEQGLLFTVSVEKAEIGKIIGKKGIIAEALKTLVRSAGYQHDVRASMRVVESI